MFSFRKKAKHRRLLQTKNKAKPSSRLSDKCYYRLIHTSVKRIASDPEWLVFRKTSQERKELSRRRLPLKLTF